MASVVIAATTAVIAVAPARAGTQPGFQDTAIIGGLINPTAVRFAANGRVFVAEKRGVVKVYDSVSDPTSTVVADLRTNVYNFWDRGLLGLALDPGFPTKPFVYVLYTHDALIGGTAPRWGAPGVDSDPCPTPPGPTSDGCVVSGRLSRFRVDPATNVMTGSEQVLIEGWCQQYPSHSVGALDFGPDGSLYVSGGDGASFTFVDYGQDGSPQNPCGDPPGGAGTALTPPTARGGSLRSQSIRRPAGEPVVLNGTILRVNPDTGEGMADNPFSSSPDANARRIIAYGLRNPFRMTPRPGTNEMWTGDVGWSDWEEINRIGNAKDTVVENFGWPCYEGKNRQSGYDAANLTMCEQLYTQGGVTAPFYSYHHSSQVVASETCPKGGSSVAGLTFRFYDGGSYPPEYEGALFFADYSRDCIWVMFKGADGQPNRSNIKTFVSAAANPVDLQIGPGGDLYYIDFDGGTIHQVRYGTGPTSCPDGQYLGEYFNNKTLTAPATFTRCDAAPVNFDWGSGGPGNGLSADNFSVRWTGRFTFASASHTFTSRADDGIRLFLDGSTVIDGWAGPPATTYQASRTVSAGVHTVKIEYYESSGNASASASWAAGAANQPPTATIATPSSDLTWKVGDVIPFSGSATDAEDGALPASSLSWSLILQHCPSTCHAHPIQTFPGVASGSLTAPDHDYPSHLELQATATDSGGLTSTTSVLLYPKAVDLTLASTPPGLQLVMGSTSGAAPFTRTVIVGSSNSVSAPTPQTLNGAQHAFSTWSDGGGQTHNLTAPIAPATYTATFAPVADTTPPTISNVRATGITATSATITWTTSEVSDSQVEYGTTAGYGQATARSTTLVTTHSVRLTNLSRFTTYHFRVKSRDAAGNLATSGNVTFRTSLL